MNRKELITDCIDNLDDNEKVNLWNSYCSENNLLDDRIYVNDEAFFKEIYGNSDIMDVIRSVNYGNYSLSNAFVVLNGYANLDSFDNPEDSESPFDTETLVDWLSSLDEDEITDYLADYEPEEEENNEIE